MANIPQDNNIDSTLSLLYDGFTFISKRCDQLESDVFETRIMGERTICMRGEEAARLFYDTARFKREGAIPSRIKKTLFGQGSVQSMDGKEHRWRKDMFMSMMKRKTIQDLTDQVESQWDNYLSNWKEMKEVILFEEVQEILCQAACIWTGIPLQDLEMRQRTGDFWSMVDAFGGVGPRHWRGRRARTRTEEWIEDKIEQIRSKKLKVPQDSPAYVVAFHRDLNDNLLNSRVAAVELINVIRPIVAISTYIVFAALALHHNPEYRNRLQGREDNLNELFVQEIRRFYPFAPLLGARARSDFEWNGIRFQEEQLTMLDVYGTNHDARFWKNPEEFDPERFRDWGGSLYGYIPQGGNNHEDGHRCAGEWITIETVKVALDQLTRKMEYTVVEDQDLEFSLSRMPTFPKSGFIISNVRRRA